MRTDGPLRRPLAWLKTRAPGLHDFLTSREKPKPAIREVLGGLLVIVLLMTVLWGATGQPLTKSPVVVVESESMMRCDEGIHTHRVPSDCSGPYGRIGTIDPGDLVFVKNVDNAGDVESAAKCLADKSRERYGACGDSIIYRPGGSEERTPIIHRAIIYLGLNGNGKFTIPECGLDQADQAEVMANECVRAAVPAGNPRTSFGSLLSRLAGEHPYNTYGPSYSGFITLGDNNDQIDQGSSIAPVQPVHPDWILGKSRGELPWLGLMKLWLSDTANGCGGASGIPCHYKAAPSDAKTMMWLSLAILIGGPVVFEKVMKYRRKVQQPPSED